MITQNIATPQAIDWSNLGPIVPLWHARPCMPTFGSGNLALSSVNAQVGLFDVPFRIQITQVAYRIGVGGTSQVRAGIYDSLGSLIFQILGSGGAGTQVVSISICITPGLYYAVACHDGTGTVPSIRTWTTDVFDLLNQNLPPGKGPLEGTIAIVGGVLPNSFDPTTIVAVAHRMPMLRFD